MKRRPLLFLATGLLLVGGVGAWWLWPRPVAEPSGVLVIQHEKGSIHLINPDGTGLRLIATYPPECTLTTAKLSPDRTRLAYAVRPENGNPTAIQVKGVDSESVAELASVLSLEYLFWSPDGRRLYGSSRNEKSQDCETWHLDPDTGERTPLPVPKEYQAWGITPDGGKLLCVRMFHSGQFGLQKAAEVVQTDLDEFRPEVIITADLGLSPLAVFPDGKRWVVRTSTGFFGTYTPGDQTVTPWPWGCYSAYRAVVSPDGSRVVVNYRTVGYEHATRATKMFDVGLTTYAPDGSDSRVVWKPEEHVNKFDWR